MKTPITYTIAITFALLGAAHAQAADNAPTSASVQQALQTRLGDKAKDLTVVVSPQGVAQLQGWATQPQDVDQARYVVSQLPGVTQAYSNGVHTWSSTNR